MTDQPDENVMEAIRLKAPNREPDPRGPDAPEKTQQHLPRIQQPDTHDYHLVSTPTPRRSPLRVVAAPPIRWIGTNFNFDPGHRVDGIVIHTEVGTNAGATGRFQQPNQASAHYGVAYDGHEVVQWVSEQNTAWHCGRYFPDATHMGNTNSIGIEHEDNGQYNSPRPDGLYETSARLVAWICQRYGLPIVASTVRGECGHRDVSIVGTACPDSLDIDRIIRRANELVAPPPPAVPPWKLALHVEPYTVTLAAPVDLYDLTTGQPSGVKVGAGTFIAGYRGVVGGVDYRVTGWSFDHGTPRGVRTADVAPPPLPPEWRRNLQPKDGTFRLTKAVGLYDLEAAPHPESVQPFSLIPIGPLSTSYITSVGGDNFLMTSYSVTKGIGRGMLQAAVLDADEKPAPPPGPAPGPAPTPDPGPPTPPPGALNWLQALLDWFKRLFGSK
jgi:hypothetical protein